MSRIKVALDFCLSHRITGVLKELYSHQGYEFLHLKDLGMKGNTPDPQWADKYKRFGGRIVLSGDCKIAYKPHEAIAFIDNGLISFFPAESWATLGAPAQAAWFVYWWPKIAAAIPNINEGTCWRIPCLARKGELRLFDGPIDPLKIPPEILAVARNKDVS